MKKLFPNQAEAIANSLLAILKEKKEVIDEANKIYDVKKVIPSIYLAEELSRNKL